VKVLDFGIASRLGQSDTDVTVFDARAEGGLTPPYASFEMLNGSRADQRDDIYAFGLVVYELLTGRHPYERKPASKVFLEQRSGQGWSPKPVRGLSRKQWQLLKSAIEILQEQRPQHLDDWLLQFDPKNQPKWLLAAVSGLLVCLVGGAGLYYLQRAPQAPEDPRPQPVIEMPQVPTAEPAPVAKPPTANVGGELQGVVGETVRLYGGDSRSQDGSPLVYSWKMTEQPAASKAVLEQPGDAAPRFVPDLPGRYVAELIVTDTGGRVSEPAGVIITISPAPEPAIEHEAVSADGSLYMAAGKSSYKIGEELKLSFRVTKPGYLRVAYVSTTGEISELLPNKYQSTKVRANVDYRIPPKADSFKLQVTGPVGTDKIVAVFSSELIPKVKDIATPEGYLTEALSDLRASSVTLHYEVVKK
ncbi:MAG: DUF4384 domain-containing protein, partial [Methylomonas sp.]|nr:DUF4384 domain-containing protein [Methylomonas sp.]